MDKYGQLSDLVENYVEKEEIVCHEQFLLFPQCFQKLSVVDESNEYLWSEGLICCSKLVKELGFFNPFPNDKF